MDVKTEATKIKARLAQRLRGDMKRTGMTQSELARRMQTSRAVVHRLLSPTDVSVTLTTMVRAAVVLDRQLSIGTARA
jgi:DNA-binding transcriptional regulator LsrR (DeoR family)